MVVNARRADGNADDAGRFFNRHVVVENELDHFALPSRQATQRANQRRRLRSMNIFERLRADGFALRLEVREDNLRAIRFYARNGTLTRRRPTA